jgi:hypothetical protein
MSKILRNPDPINSVDLFDVGVSIPGNSNYTIPPQDYSQFAASSDVLRALADVRLILNDGGNDIIVLSDAVDIIKGWFPNAATNDEEFFFDYADVPIGVGPHTIFSYTVDSFETVFLNRLNVSCRQEAMFLVFKNGVSIADLRTGASRPSAEFIWYPSREFVAGDLIEVVLMRRTGSPDVTVGAHMMALRRPITA